MKPIPLNAQTRAIARRVVWFESPAQALADPLSDRELEVLRLIAANRSNQEIAETLIVSVNTVKTHINRLYVKLGAHNRLEAVERAQELHLL